MQGRVRQQHAEPGIPGRDERRDRCLAPSSRDDDRPLGRREEVLFRLVEVGQGDGRFEVAHHDGERLLEAALSRAQPLDSGVGSCVAGQVVPADPLDRDDLAAAEGRLRGSEGRIGALHRAAVAVLEPEAWPTVGAGHRLRVEAAVRRVVVLRGAGVTQGERLHGRVRAVVGEADRDGETRTAVRAIDERVARPAVGGVEELVETVGAGRDVRRHERPDSALIVALDDGKTRLAGRCEVLALDRGDAGRPGRTGHQPGHELVCRRAVALDFDEHALGVVADVAGQAELGGEPVDVRPEPDPLDQPGHAETEANHRPRRGQAGHAGEPLRRPRVTAASRCIRPKL